MKRHARNNLLLAGAAGAALIVALALKPEQPEPNPSLVDIEPSSVTQIRLSAGEDPPIVVERGDAGWRITAPITAPANRTEIDVLLAVANSESQRRMAVDELDLVPIGLAPPRFVLELDDKTLAFGRTEALSGQRYVRAGDTVHLIADISASSFDSNYADLVDRALLTDLGELQHIEVPELVVSRGEAGWRAQPAAESADTVQAFVDHWRHARAMWIVRPSPEERETGGPVLSITGQEGGARFVVLRTDPQLELLRADLDLKYVMPAAAAGELLQLPQPRPQATTTEQAPAEPDAPAS